MFGRPGGRLLFMGLVGLLIPLLVALYAWNGHRHDVELRRTGVVVPGTVVGVERGSSGTADVHVVLADEARFHGAATTVPVSTDARKPPAVGSVIPVVVDPSNPQHAVAEFGAYKAWDAQLFGAFCALVVMLVILLLALRQRQRARRPNARFPSRR
jgi:hypothetical protein